MDNPDWERVDGSRMGRVCTSRRIPSIGICVSFCGVRSTDGKGSRFSSLLNGTNTGSECLGSVSRTSFAPVLGGPFLQYWLRRNGIAACGSNVYDSWLLTIEGRPLTIRLSTDYLSRTFKTQQTDDGLEISLHPKTIDVVGGRIETAVGLQSVLPDGSVNETQTTVWLGEDIVTPVAVVTRHYRQGRNSGYQYFALYLTCSIIPEDMLPSEAPLFPMGNIAGMEELMMLPEPPRTMELGVGMEYGGGDWSGFLQGMVPLGNAFDIYGSFRFPNEACYQLGIGCRLHEELTLLLLVEQGEILVGVQDGLALTPQLYVSARLLPVEIVLSEPSIQKKLRLDWAVTYS